ncbi:MAG: ABC transporter permease [Haloarculaceae archaeon]
MSERGSLRRLRDRAGSERDDSLPPVVTALSVAVALAVLSPLAWLFLRAGEVPPARTWSLLVSDTTLEVLANTAALVAAVTTASVLLGVPLAVLTVQTDLPFRRFWTVTAALPLVIPSYIGAFAFVSAFGPRGALADALAPFGVQQLPPIYGFLGAAMVLTLYTYPYVFLTTRASLQSFDGRLVEAARTLNHSRWQAFKRVTLPQIRPGVTAGALLVALYALSDFGTPQIMHFDVFTRMIYVEFGAFQQGYAALLSIALLAVTVAILGLESRFSGEEGNAYVSRGTRAPERIRLGAWKWPALAFVGGVAALCLVVPIAILLMWLVRDNPAYAGGGFTFEWVYAFNSVNVSLTAAVVAVVASIPVAYLSVRSDHRLARLVDRATYVGYAVPGIVLGLALIYFGLLYAPFLYRTIPLLVFAYVVRFLPQSVGTVRTSLLQVDPKLMEAARTLGESPLRSFRRVVLPLVLPGVLAGGALVFLTTMKELPATLMLRPSGFETFVTFIWLVQGAGYYGEAAVPALVLVLISGLTMLVTLGRDRYAADSQ